MAKKPYDHHKLSDVPCQHPRKASNCPGFIKANVIARKPASTICYKCTPEGRRDTKRKVLAKEQKERLTMEANK